MDVWFRIGSERYTTVLGSLFRPPRSYRFQDLLSGRSTYPAVAERTVCLTLCELASCEKLPEFDPCRVRALKAFRVVRGLHDWIVVASSTSGGRAATLR